MAPLLTVVIPVYNGGDQVVANVKVIRQAVAGGVPEREMELIVVSDGSIDGTAERLLESRTTGTRVLHYNRNLGKGYAVKAGALAAHGDWIALVDADLDLDPRSIPDYLDAARRDAEDVLPLLLVKRFAFDLELLAVAKSLGYDRIRELPIRLEYRFSGSGVGSLAVLAALWDTAAIFYRLRILRTYERKRPLFHGAAAAPPAEPPLVTVIGEPDAAALLDYPRVEVLAPGKRAETPAATGELVAILGEGARPAGNWATAAVPFFADRDVAAVVVPTVSPLAGSLGRRPAAAVLESRLGAGSRRSSYLPGNVRQVADHSAESIMLRRAGYPPAP